MEQNIFIEKFYALLPECQPGAAQTWCDFAVERVDQQQYVHFKVYFHGVPIVVSYRIILAP